MKKLILISLLFALSACDGIRFFQGTTTVNPNAMARMVAEGRTVVRLDQDVAGVPTRQTNVVPMKKPDGTGWCLYNSEYSLVCWSYSAFAIPADQWPFWHSLTWYVTYDPASFNSGITYTCGILSDADVDLTVAGEAILHFDCWI